MNTDIAAAPGLTSPASEARRDIAPKPALSLADAGSADRALLEQHVASRFARQYGATIDQFLPLLLRLDLGNQPGAIAGLRFAGRSALFLEQYLDRPVEQAVARRFCEPVDRHQIVEIGNLVSLLPGAASMLFALLPGLLDAAGVRWVVCTATPQVRAMLSGLGFPSKTICAADPAALGEGVGSWGSYYESRPRVIAGDVKVAARLAGRNADARRLRRVLAGPLEDATAVLYNARR